MRGETTETLIKWTLRCTTDFNARARLMQCTWTNWGPRYIRIVPLLVFVDNFGRKRNLISRSLVTHPRKQEDRPPNTKVNSQNCLRRNVNCIPQSQLEKNKPRTWSNITGIGYRPLIWSRRYSSGMSRFWCLQYWKANQRSVAILESWVDEHSRVIRRILQGINHCSSCEENKKDRCVIISVFVVW